MIFLGDFLGKDCILPRTELQKKDDILHKIAELAKKSPVLQKTDEDEIYTALKQREEIGSTAFSHNIAIPHCTLDNIDKIVMGVIAAPEGAEFNALDGEKTKLFVFMISPASQRNAHIRLLSETSRLLHLPNFISRIVEMDKPETIYKFFLDYTRYDKSVEVETEEEKYNFQVIVQEEDRFEELMEIFTSVQNCYLAVMEVEEASYYMRKMPLFASFWTSDSKGFSKLIMAIVDKTWTNDTIRKIDMLINDAGKNPKIMLMVQELFYFNGSMNI